MHAGVESWYVRGVMHKSYHMVIRYLSLYLVFDLVFQTLSKGLRELAVWNFKKRKKVRKFAKWRDNCHGLLSITVPKALKFFFS